MNFRSICAGLLGLILLAACGSAPATPLAPPTSAPTAVPVSAQQIPTDIPLPTVAPTKAAPTAAPQPEATPTTALVISTARTGDDGPQLIVPSANGLQLFSADGTLVQTFDQAQLTLGRNLSDGIAPTGGSVAFLSGDNPMTPDREGSGPLMLNLLDTRTGKQNPITPLFSPEMTQALQETISTGDRNEAVEAGIAIAENSGTLAWSPNGRYLAFIAAIDGPSSDLYSYDRESAQIKRLTDGPNQAARLFWSPDSKWIIHEEVESFGTGAGWNVKAVWAAAPDDSGNRKLYDTESSGDEVFVDWVAPDTFLVYSWTPIGLQDIRLVNLDTGEAQRSGPDYAVQALAFDPVSQAQLTVVDDFTAQQNNLQGGLYLTSSSKQSQRVASGNWYDVRWLPQAQMFFAKGESGVISVALDGTTKEYSGEGALPIAAPDGAWLLAWGDGNYTDPIGLRLYTTDGELKRDLTQDAVTFATWSPDSAGVFYVSDGMLHYVSIPNGEPQLIAEDLITTEAGSMGWVMP
jgi:WD40-like Beta Propeller Repeat